MTWVSAIQVVHPDEVSHVSRHTGGCARHAVTLAVLEVLEDNGIELVQTSERICVSQVQRAGL